MARLQPATQQHLRIPVFFKSGECQESLINVKFNDQDLIVVRIVSFVILGSNEVKAIAILGILAKKGDRPHMRLIAPYYRCRIDDDEFKVGDGTLLEVSVELGEEQRASKCSFTIYDRGLFIGARYQILSLKSGGIETPPNLIKNQSTADKNQSFTTKGFEDPNAAPSISSAPTAGSPPISRTTSTSGGTVSTQNPPFSPQVRAFMDLIAYKEVHSDVTLSIKGYYSNNDVQGSNGFFDDADVARGGGFPASAGHGFNVGRYQFKWIDWNDARKTNSNIKGYSPADQDLVCYYKLQYRKALQPLLAGDIATAIRNANKEWASMPGSPYGQVQRGYTVDQAIAYYKERLRVYSGQNQRTMVPTSPPPTSPAIQTTPQQQLQEVSKKGTEIIIELGFEPDQLIAYHFIHTGTESLRGDRDTTVFTGQSIRWLLTRRTENKSYENINLRQLAQSVCKKHNLVLEMEGNGPTYHFLDQSGITDYELLLRQCRSIGYTVRDEGNKLILKPSGRPEFCGMVFNYESLINIKFTDKARGERKTWAGVGAYSASSAIPASETKTVIDRQSGKIEQQKKEDTAGTGKAQSPNSITGAIAPPITGNVKPDNSKTASTNPVTQNFSKKEPEKREVKTVKNANGTGSEVTTIINKAIARGTITTKVETQTKTGSATAIQVVTTTETTKGTTIDTENVSANNIITKSSTSNNRVSKEALDSLKLTDAYFKPPSVPVTANPAALPNDPESGLPRQPIGAIAINEGKIEGQTLVVEQHRVRGYESTMQVLTTPEVLTLLPGQIIGISGRVVPSPFDREWRISSVRHKFPGGISDIQIYTPQAAKTPDNVSTFEKSGGAIADTAKPAATVPTGPTNFIFPVPHGATTIGDGFGVRAGRPPGYRHKILDITAPAGTIAVAMADGVVTEVIPNNGGAGNMMTIQYAGGYESTYMHGLAGGFLVKKGDAVKQGQPVFKIGSTGFSSGNHLHARFLHNKQVCLLSQVGIDVLHMGLPIHRYNPMCDKY